MHMIAYTISTHFNLEWHTTLKADMSYFHCSQSTSGRCDINKDGCCECIIGAVHSLSTQSTNKLIC